MYSQTITFRTGRAHARAAIPALLELVHSGRLRSGLVTNAIAAWDDAAEVLSDHCGKTVVVAEPPLSKGLSGQETDDR